MELKDQIIGKLAEPLIEEAKNTITEEERKRRSLPNIQLSTIETEFLVGLANGRTIEELNSAIKLYSKDKHTYNTIYNLLSQKFETNTLTHLLYKAIKLGFIN